MSAGTSRFASSAARPAAPRGSRSALGRPSGGACCARNRATGALAPDAPLVTVAALRCARLGVLRRPPESVERAALSMLRRDCGTALPFGTRAGDSKYLKAETKVFVAIGFRLHQIRGAC